MLRKYRSVACAGVVGLVLTVAGCGSSTTSGSSGSGHSGSGNGSSSSPIVVGSIGTYSGVNGVDFAGDNETLQAWAKAVNASGGLDGHPVKMVTLDDADSPSTGLADAKELVEQDHVVAIVGQMSSVLPVWASYIEQQHIPFIGGETVEPEDYQSADFFPVGTTTNFSVADEVAYAKKQDGVTKGAFFYCVENSVCAESVPFYKAAYKTAGGTLVFDTATSATAPDYTAPCLAGKQAGAQALTVAAPSEEAVKILHDCATQGWKPTLVLESYQLTPDLAKSFAGTKSVFGADDVSFVDTSAPGAKQFRSVVAKYAPSVLSSSTFTESDLIEWASAELLSAAVKAIPSGGSPTSAGIVSGLDTLKNETLGGLTPPLTFTKGKPTSVKCIFIASLKGSKIVEPLGATPFCPFGK